MTLTQLCLLLGFLSIFKFFSDVTRVFCKGWEERKGEEEVQRMFQTFDVVF